MEELEDAMELEELLEIMKTEGEKKNFRNWINEKFPQSYAGGYNFYYVMTHPWELLSYWKRQIRWAWQRVFRGWDDRATWAVDYYFANILPQIIRKLKEEKHGIPVQMFDSDPYPVENEYLGYNDEDMVIAEEKWNKILDEIADGFENYKTIDEVPLAEREKAYQDFFDGAFELFKKYFVNLWD